MGTAPHYMTLLCGHHISIYLHCSERKMVTSFAWHSPLASLMGARNCPLAISIPLSSPNKPKRKQVQQQLGVHFGASLIYTPGCNTGYQGLISINHKSAQWQWFAPRMCITIVIRYSQSKMKLATGPWRSSEYVQLGERQAVWSIKQHLVTFRWREGCRGW